MQPKLHMIYGPVGAGKTTAARRIAAEARAIHFDIDDWMMTLFWKDSSGTPDLAWALERVDLCETMVWKIARQALAGGQSAVADLGFMTRAQRNRFRARAAEYGVALEEVYVIAEREARRSRVRQRNLDASRTIEVGDAMFDWAESYFEAPDDDEMGLARVIDTDEG
jgi:predicted kinase